MTPLLLAAALLFAVPVAAHAQSSCSSDGQPQPTALLERFISADCEACWTRDDTSGRPGRGELALDWIVPGTQGENAPLSAVASRDALQRLQALGRMPPAQADAVRTRRQGKAPLRVAHGLPFNDYIGASIEQRPARAGTQTVWLALVETIPAGSDGTLVARNLVRNLLVAEWNGARGAKSLAEARSMAIGANAQAERLRVVGWVQDARGRITSIVQSLCPPDSGQG